MNEFQGFNQMMNFTL